MDRNIFKLLAALSHAASPSSRRAWIEIIDITNQDGGADVALLAEGVDRNMDYLDEVLGDGASPSSRRAWIEILLFRILKLVRMVALLAEGVDRNKLALAQIKLCAEFFCIGVWHF